MARNNPRINEVTLLSAAFIRWGLGLFIFGLIIGYSPLVHYLHGVLEKMGRNDSAECSALVSVPLCGADRRAGHGRHRSSLRVIARPQA